MRLAAIALVAASCLASPALAQSAPATTPWRIMPGIPTVGASNVDVYSNYFLVNGRVKLNRAALQIQALMKRNGRGPSAKTQLVWIREN